MNVNVVIGDLKPCPFCGNKNITIDTCHDLEDCENFESCEDTGYKTTIKAAAEVWNRREN